MLLQTQPYPPMLQNEYDCAMRHFMDNYGVTRFYANRLTMAALDASWHPTCTHTPKHHFPNYTLRAKRLHASFRFNLWNHHLSEMSWQANWMLIEAGRILSGQPTSSPIQWPTHDEPTAQGTPLQPVRENGVQASP